jgi:hypothetical protein
MDRVRVKDRVIQETYSESNPVRYLPQNRSRRISQQYGQPTAGSLPSEQRERISRICKKAAELSELYGKKLKENKENNDLQNIPLLMVNGRDLRQIERDVRRIESDSSYLTVKQGSHQSFDSRLRSFSDPSTVDSNNSSAVRRTDTSDSSSRKYFMNLLEDKQADLKKAREGRKINQDFLP